MAPLTVAAASQGTQLAAQGHRLIHIRPAWAPCTAPVTVQRHQTETRPGRSEACMGVAWGRVTVYARAVHGTRAPMRKQARQQPIIITARAAQ